VTATDGGPAIQAAASVGTGGASTSGGELDVSARAGQDGLRTVLGLARVEASMLVRNVLVLAGLLTGGFFIWFIIHLAKPLWWNAAWQIGYGQLILAIAVLVAAQLAAGRARRNGMTDLYASFPVTAARRGLGFLIGLAGVLPASVLLIGAGVVVVQVLVPVGTPSAAVLAAGPLLVLAAGAAGSAIGARFSHPMAGVLGALALFLSSATTHVATGAGVWLVPWQVGQDQLGSLPGPLAGYPPGAEHAVELAAIAVLAGVVALALAVRGAKARGGLAAAGAVALALVCLAGVLQARPIPTASLNHLVREVADPASVQRCTTANQVRYCLYPGFGDVLPSLQAPVSGVLAHLPARPAQRLTVMQVGQLSFPETTLTHGHSARQVARWTVQLQRAPGTGARASAIYLPIGSWPTGRGAMADVRFDLALAAADWAVHLAPTISSSEVASTTFQSCVPLDQAREPIAIWLAILAARPPASELQAGLTARTAGPAEVANTWVITWAYPGSQIGGYLSPGGTAPTTTAVGYLLAHEMTMLPAQKVTRILGASWSKWTSWHATYAQLAAALGIRLPHVAASVPPAPPGVSLQSGPQQPVCTS
jgi:hypothetical protein